MELLKIGELAERAGVQRATVAFYVREGLLPPPVKKPHRNMAYYSAEVVEQIKLIKELQTSRFLPLAVIKELLADRKGIEEIRSFIASQPLAPELRDRNEPGGAQEPAGPGLTDSEVDHLEQLGVVAPSRGGQHGTEDLAILRAVGQMKRAGFGEIGGFEAEELNLYREAMEGLIHKEVSLFAKRVVGERRRSREEVIGLARAGLESTNALLIAMRRKIFLQVLEDIVPEEGLLGGE